MLKSYFKIDMYKFIIKQLFLAFLILSLFKSDIHVWFELSLTFPEYELAIKEAEILIIDSRCTNCARCVWSCPIEVLEFKEEGVKT